MNEIEVSDPLLEAGLAPVRLSDKPEFDAAFATLKQPVSDYTFAGTYMWSGALRLFWRRLSRHICVFANGTGDLSLMLPPIPDPDARPGDLADAVNASFEIMDTYNDGRRGRGRSVIEYVSDEMLERFSSERGLSLAATPMWADYVYETARMIDLAGGPLKSKRHSRSRFLRDHPDHRVEELGPEHTEACVELLNHWASHGDAVHEGEISDADVGTEVLRERDRLSTTLAIREMRELGISGLALYVGERLAGFTLGEVLSPSQAVIMVEKTDPEYHGAPQFIFSEFCARAWASYPECNVGDDWGIPGLRFTKQSYRPIRLLSKYLLTRQSIPTAVGIGTPDPTGLVEPRGADGDRIAPADPVAPPSRGPMAPTIRCGRPGDAVPIHAIELRSFAHEGERFTRRQIRGLLSNPRAAVRVAEVDGEVIGWAASLLRQHKSGRCSGRLYAVAVAPEARGRGIGLRLVTETLQELRGRGAGRLSLEVRHGNDAAIALYQRLGFSPADLLPGYYGAGIDGVRMVLDGRLESPRPG